MRYGVQGLATWRFRAFKVLVTGINKCLHDVQSLSADILISTPRKGGKYSDEVSITNTSGFRSIPIQPAQINGQRLAEPPQRGDKKKHKNVQRNLLLH